MNTVRKSIKTRPGTIHHQIKNDHIILQPANVFIRRLNDRQQKAVIDNSTVTQYKAKDVIFRQNTRTAHVMYIKEGFVKIFKEEKYDMATIFKFVTSNHFIGLSTIFGKENYQYSCSAIEPTEVLSIDLNVFKEILHENQNFNLYLIESLCGESLYAFNKLAQQSHKHMPGRIADVLLYFSEELFRNDSFTLPVTRKEIAEYAGITSESVIRTFTEFKCDKIIDIIGNDIKINSKDILKTLSNNG